MSSKEQDALFLFLFPSTGWNADKIAWTLSSHPRHREAEATGHGEHSIAREEIWVSGNFKMLPYQFWAALFLTFMWEKYISFSSHYYFEFSHLYSWPVPTTQEGYWKNMIQEHMLQTKPSYMGNGYGTAQPLLVYPDPWGLCLWVSLWICSHLLVSLHGWTFSACLLIS